MPRMASLTQGEQEELEASGALDDLSKGDAAQPGAPEVAALENLPAWSHEKPDCSPTGWNSNSSQSLFNS